MIPPARTGNSDFPAPSGNCGYQGSAEEAPMNAVPAGGAWRILRSLAARQGAAAIP